MNFLFGILDTVNLNISHNFGIIDTGHMKNKINTNKVSIKVPGVLAKILFLRPFQVDPGECNSVKYFF